MTDEIVEVSRSQLSALQRVKALADDLWNDEKVGMALKERTKEKYPDSNIPEVVVAQHTRKAEQEMLARVEAKNKEVDERISAFEKAQKERDEKDANARAEQTFAADVESTKKKYQLTAEGMEKVFARMKEKNNPDVEAAAAWVTDHEPKLQPTASSSYSPMNPFGVNQEDKDWALLNKNPWDGKFAEQEINRIQDDFAHGRGNLYGLNGMGGEL